MKPEEVMIIRNGKPIFAVKLKVSNKKSDRDTYVYIEDGESDLIMTAGLGIWIVLMREKKVMRLQKKYSYHSYRQLFATKFLN